MEVPLEANPNSQEHDGFEIYEIRFNFEGEEETSQTTFMQQKQYKDGEQYFATLRGVASNDGGEGRTSVCKILVHHCAKDLDNKHRKDLRKMAVMAMADEETN